MKICRSKGACLGVLSKGKWHFYWFPIIPNISQLQHKGLKLLKQFHVFHSFFSCFGLCFSHWLGILNELPPNHQTRKLLPTSLHLTHLADALTGRAALHCLPNAVDDFNYLFWPFGLCRQKLPGIGVLQVFGGSHRLHLDFCVNFSPRCGKLVGTLCRESDFMAIVGGSCSCFINSSPISGTLAKALRKTRALLDSWGPFADLQPAIMDNFQLS